MKRNFTYTTLYRMANRCTGFYFFIVHGILLLLLTIPGYLSAQITRPTIQQMHELRLKNTKTSTAAQGNKAANTQNLLTTLTVAPANAVTNPLLNIIQSLAGPGVTISNIQTNISDNDQNALHIYGSFSGGLNVVGLDKGLLMTTGSVENALGPNSEPWKSQDNGLPGYLTSDTAGFDAAVISFDVTSATSFLTFKYVFASDEYNEYVGSPFNDAFAFFITGPGIPAGTNIALIPGTATTVAINNVNLGLNSQYYLDNDSAAHADGLADPFRFQNLEYDGLTRVLTTSAITVVPGAIYRITLVIQDFEDPIYDSGVFIEGGSITGNPCVLGLSMEKNDVSCHGANDGSIELYYYGATGIPSFAWTNGATTQEVEHLGPGSYNVTVTDQQGCTSTFSAPVVINEPPTMTLAVPIVSNASCGGGINGSATVSASGGTPPYQYASGSITNTTGTFINLAPGTHNYLVTDAHDCSQTGSFIIPSVSNMSCSITVTSDPVTPGQATNTIFLGYGPQSLTLTGSANSGAAPYTYNWGSAGTGNSITVSPVSTTTYTLVVTDNNGCQSTCNTTITVIDVRCSNDRIQVCHKDNKGSGQAICISASAIPAHLAHGDYLGACNISAIDGLLSKAGLPGKYIDGPTLSVTVLSNPSSGHFTLKIGSGNMNEKLTLRIFDLYGRQIEVRNNLTAGQIVVLGNNYKAGTYMAEIVKGTQRVIWKLVKFVDY